jgi:hypothetical protein
MLHGAELDELIEGLLRDYLARNSAARTLQRALDEAGVGFWAVADHLTIRTLDIDARARQFVELGYALSETLEYGDWFARVYRAPGYPALFVDQAYPDQRGATSLIPGWVASFGDKTFHHVAVRVEEIDNAVSRLRAQGVVFAGEVLGERGGELRQVFTAPELVEGKPFSVLELTERHRGYQGFSPPQADQLMRSSAAGQP